MKNCILGALDRDHQLINTTNKAHVALITFPPRATIYSFIFLFKWIFIYRKLVANIKKCYVKIKSDRTSDLYSKLVYAKPT